MSIDGFQPGDHVEMTVQGTVTEVRRINGAPAALFFTDTADTRWAVTSGAATFELLSWPKPPEGSVINGRRLKNTWWKRGTIIHAQKLEASQLVLLGDGTWIALDVEHLGSARFEFGHFADAGFFTVVHLP